MASDDLGVETVTGSVQTGGGLGHDPGDDGQGTGFVTGGDSLGEFAVTVDEIAPDLVAAPIGQRQQPGVDH